MNNTQIKNTLDWVEAMLSGKFKHGKHVLFNPRTGCHCAVAVACEIMGIERLDTYTSGIYLFVEEAGNTVLPSKRHTAVPEVWFKRTFGLPHDQRFYNSFNDNSKNYLGVCTMLLKAVHDVVPNSDRWATLSEKLNDAAKIWTKSGGL